MQKAPVMKGSGLKPLDVSKSNEEAHVFGKNLEERVVTKEGESPSISINDSRVDEDIDSIRKRKFDAITGEEDEETIFQGDFKLFIWDLPSSNWIEKGRGQLKLNDSINEVETKSRVIMRLSGTLRIVLNVALEEKFRVIANSKDSLRFTDGQNLWAARGSNADQLKNLIEDRLSTIQSPKDDDKPSQQSGDDRPIERPDDVESPKKPDVEKAPERLQDATPSPKSKDIEPSQEPEVEKPSREPEVEKPSQEPEVEKPSPKPNDAKLSQEDEMPPKRTKID